LSSDWSDDDIVAQALIFLLGGLETVSAMITFALHELALNPEVQEKLIKEIKECEIKTNGQLDYTALQNLVYLDMVMSGKLNYQLNLHTLIIKRCLMLFLV
jgi:cytochrome P450